MIGLPNSYAKVLNNDAVFNQKTRRKNSIDFQSAKKKASRCISKVKFLRLKKVAVEGNLSQKTRSPIYELYTVQLRKLFYLL